MTTKVTVPGIKNLQTTAEISNSIRGYYGNLKLAKEKKIPVIWSFGLIPREIYHAVDAPVLFLEHLPLMMGAKQLSGKYMEIAEEDGFSRDVCAFHRCFAGCAIAEEKDPYLDSFFVTPDLIIASNLPCISESKSFLYSADLYNCPYYFVDGPINTWGKNIPDHAIKYYSSQLQGALDFMEEHGFKVDMDRLKESVKLSLKMIGLWNEIDDLRKTVPTPMSAVDGLTAAYPLIQLAGTQTGVTLYERLRDELKEKVKNKEGVIENEQLRLLWVGVPPFFNMGLINYVEKYGAVVAKSMIEYLAGGAYDPSLVDPEKPLEGLAYKSLVDIINPTAENMLEFIAKSVKEFQIDGIIGAVKRSCGLLPGYFRMIKDSVFEYANVPTTIFDLDGLDIREYDDATTKGNLDSFVESLLASKRR